MPNSVVNIEIEIPSRARAVLEKDAVMKQLLKDLKLAFPKPWSDVYQDLIEAIVYQQISIKAAKTIFDRMVAHFGGVLPDPQELAIIDVDELRSLGLSSQKANYMINIATFFGEHRLNHDSFVELTDDQVVALLTKIKGVGEWTVQMILIFSLFRPNVFPVADYGIQSAMESLYGLEFESKKEQTRVLQEIAKKWEPYCTFGTLLLWSWKRAQMNLS